jgi:hypothetical protein
MIDMQEILALLVAFGEAVGSKSSEEFSGMQVIECLND